MDELLKRRKVLAERLYYAIAGEAILLEARASGYTSAVPQARADLEAFDTAYLDVAAEFERRAKADG